MSDNPLLEPLFDFAGDNTGALVVIVSTVLIGSYIMIHQLFGPYVERKVMSRMQGRQGPKYVGLKGLLQIPADLLKLVFKEDITPASADKLGFFISIFLIAVTSILSFAPLPFGSNFISGDLSIGVLYVFAIFSIFPPAMFIGGWSGNSKYALVGGFRSAGQLLAYEIPMFVSAFAVIINAGTFSLLTITELQMTSTWYLFDWWGLGFVAGFIFFISGVAETERIPFDIPEAEAELVMGPRTEFSGWRYALIMMVEYLHLTVNSFLFIFLFFGGYDPIPIPATEGSALYNFKYFQIGDFYIVQFIAITVKLYLFIIIAAWFRSALPRMRIDQLLNMGWKHFLPVSIFATAGILFMEDPELYGITPFDNPMNYIVDAIVGLVIILGIAYFNFFRKSSRMRKIDLMRQEAAA